MEKRMFRKFVPALLLLLILAACGPTGYQKVGAGLMGQFGYKDKRISDSEFSIFVNANPETSLERVAHIAMLRAANITLEQKKTHFTVIKAETDKLTQKRPIMLFVGAPIIFVPVGEAPSTEPYALLIIRLLGKNAKAGPKALNAAQIAKKLRAEFDAD